MSSNFPGRPVKTYLKDPLRSNNNSIINKNDKKDDKIVVGITKLVTDSPKRVELVATEENPLAPVAIPMTFDRSNDIQQQQQSSIPLSSPNSIDMEDEIPVISEENQIATEYITFFRGSVPSSKIAQINPLSLPVNEESLELLGNLRLWNHTLSMVEKMIKKSDININDTLRGLNYRLAALMKLHRYDDAKDVIKQVHKLVSLNEEKTNIPFTIRLLEATLPHLEGDTDKTLDLLLQLYNSLYNELRTVRMENQSREQDISIREELFAQYKKEDVNINDGDDILSSTSPTKPIRSFSVESDLLDYQDEETLKRDMKRATLQLVSLYQYRQEYEVCVQLMTSLIEELPDDLELVEYLGRILLQEGNITSAQGIFTNVSERSLKNGIPVDEVMLNKDIYESLVLMARSQFLKVYNILHKHVEDKLTNRKSISKTKILTIVNNYAMAALYANKIGDAVVALESLMSKDPIRFIDETLVFNLSTLYELSSTRSNIKKAVLKRIIREYGPDDFDMTALRE